MDKVRINLYYNFSDHTPPQSSILYFKLTVRGIVVRMSKAGGDPASQFSDGKMPKAGRFGGTRKERK